MMMMMMIIMMILRYEKFSRRVFGRGGSGQGEAAGLGDTEDLYVDLTDNSPDLIPHDGEPRTIYMYIYIYILVSLCGLDRQQPGFNPP